MSGLYLYDTPDEVRRVHVCDEKTRYESYRLGVTVAISEMRKFFERAVVYNDLCIPFADITYANTHLECGIFDNVDNGMYTIANPLGWVDLVKCHLLKQRGLDYKQRGSWGVIEWHNLDEVRCDPLFMKTQEMSDDAMENIRSISRVCGRNENAANILWGVEHAFKYGYDYSIFAFIWLYSVHRDYATESIEERWNLIEDYAKSYSCWRNVKRYDAHHKYRMK